MEDIIKDMSEADKASVVNTVEEDLIMFHDGWGMGIRNGYNLWHDKALVKALGAENDDYQVIVPPLMSEQGPTEGMLTQLRDKRIWTPEDGRYHPDKGASVWIAKV